MTDRSSPHEAAGRSVPSTEREQEGPPPRTAPGLLLDRTFGPFLAGKLFMALGVWAHSIAAAIVVWELTGSALLVGAVSAGQFLPQLLLSPWSGARADRSDRLRQIVAGRLVTASGSFALVAWSATMGISGSLGAAAVITASTVVGIGFALGGPAMQALLPALVRPSELPGAVALNSMPMTLARAAGPAIGAIVVTTFGETVAFGLAGATNLLYVLVLLQLRITTVERPPTRDGRIRAGWNHVRSDRSMATLLLGVVAIGIGADPVVTLTPSIAADLGATSAFVGVLASAFGVGAGSIYLVLGVLRTRLGLARMGTTGLLLMAVALTGLAFAPARWFAVVVLVLGGMGMTMSLTSLTTLIQQQVPEDLRGRVMALWSVGFLGSRPVAAAMSGALADTVSVRVALLAVVAVLCTGAVVARPSRTVARVPTPPSTVGPDAVTDTT